MSIKSSHASFSSSRTLDEGTQETRDAKVLRNAVVELFELSDDDSILKEEENASVEYIFTDNYEFMYDPKQGPIEGMEFSSLKEVFAFYRKHAKHAGFSVIRRSVMKLKDSNSQVCSIYV